MPGRHIALTTLEGKTVSGYSIRIINATDDYVEGELHKSLRLPLSFRINAKRMQFEADAIQEDILREFEIYVRQEGHALTGKGQLTLNY